ncbi:MAG: M23 family metallopeptidase [Candidatus Cloacimonetes bacterium]|nr:M23 family metallopeptidase [Candidatus Cloacimonadota bacterium]
MIRKQPYGIIIVLIAMVLLSCSGKQEFAEEAVDPFIYRSGSLEKGQTLAQALMAQDISSPAVYRVVNKLNEIYNLRRCHPADSFYVKIDSLGIIHELRYMPDHELRYLVIKDTTDNYFTKIDTLMLVYEIKKCRGTITSSLYQAMIDQGEGSALPVMFTQIFQWDIDFFIDPQRDDEFNLLYEQYTLNGRFIKYGNILAASYKSRNYEKIAYRYTDRKNITKYYDYKGQCFQKTFLKSPLNYKRITSYFGYRTHPITKKSLMHNGVDYAAAYGTPVEASADGTVIHRGWKGGHPTVNGKTGGYGNTIMIRHANGYKTLYGHLSRYGNFKVGDRVKQHDIIGYVGSTGLSTGNHLHYTIYQHDKPVDPLKLKNVSGPPVSRNEMENFQALADSLNLQLQIDSLNIQADAVIEEFDAGSAEEDKSGKSYLRLILMCLLILLIILILVRIFLLLKKRRRYFY